MTTVTKGTVMLPVPVRPHKYPVLDQLCVLADTLYADQMAAMERDLKALLKQARGLDKGLMLVLGSHGQVLHGEDALMKALNPKAPKANAPKVKKPAVKKDRKPVQHPGSKGSYKWYRDDHGNVVYGERPTPRFHTQLNQEEVQNLHKQVYQFMQDAGEDSGIWEALKNAGVGLNTGDLALIRDINAHIRQFGGDVQQVFAEHFTLNGGDEEDALNAWNELNKDVQAAVDHPAVQAAMKRSIKSKMELDKAVDDVLTLGKAVKGQAEDWVHGDPEEATLKILGTGIKHQLFAVAAKKSDIDPADRKHWRSKLGRVNISNAMLQELYPYRDRFSPEQGMAFSLAALMGGEDELYNDFKSDLLDKLAAGKSDEEKADIEQKVNERLFNAKKQLELWDSNQGGKAVDQLFADEDKLDRILAGRGANAKKEIEQLKQDERDYQQLVQDALTAQDNAKPPEGGYSAAITKSGLKLKDYQNKFVNWMLTVKRGVNAADMGLGKTPMTIATVDALMKQGKVKRGVLVMPPTLMAQWPNEIEKFRPGSKTVVIDDSMSAEKRKKLIDEINAGNLEADFIIMSAGVARQYDRSRIKLGGDDGNVDFDPETGELINVKETEEEMEVEGKKVKKKTKRLTPEQLAILAEGLKSDPWIQSLKKLDGAFFYDEAHSESQGLKNPNNVSNLACREINGDPSKGGRQYAYFLTGTPIPNEPIDLYHLMDTVHPGSAGANAAKFIGKIAHWEDVFNEESGKVESKLVGYENLESLKKDIAPFCFIKKSDDPEVMKENKLPPAISQSHLPAMYPEQAEMYMRAATEWFNPPEDYDPAEDEGKGPFGKRFNTLVKINQMRQAAIHPRLLDPEYKGRGGKMDVALDIIRQKFSRKDSHDRCVIVFCSYSKAFDLLEEELKKMGIDPSQVGRIASGVDNKTRAVLQDAANDGKLKVLMVGIKAGGAGLNLQGKTQANGQHTGPDEAIFLDKPWAPGALQQAMKRYHRLGQKNTVTTHHMRAIGSYDEQLLEKLQSKTQVQTGIERAGAGSGVVEVAAQGEVAKLLHEWVSSGGKKGLNFAEMTPEERKNVTDTMKTLLGREDIHETGDEAVAQMLGFSLKDKDAAEKRKALAKMKLQDFMRAHFDMSDYEDKRAERVYLQMGGQRIKNQMAVLDAQLRSKEISRAEYHQQKSKLQQNLSRWEASMKAGKEISRKEMREMEGGNGKQEPNAFAAYAKERKANSEAAQEKQHKRALDRATKGKSKKQVKREQEKMLDDATKVAAGKSPIAGMKTKAKQLKDEPPEHVFYTKKAPYTAKDPGRIREVWDAAHALGASTPEKLVKEVKKLGASGKELEEYKRDIMAAFKRFQRDGLLGPEKARPIALSPKGKAK